MALNIGIWILSGAVAGWIASIIMKRNAQMGPIVNIVVGVIGAFSGGYLMDMAGVAGRTGFNLNGLLVAILGAGVLLFLLGKMSRTTA